jgi:hypothetical protein
LSSRRHRNEWSSTAENTTSASSSRTVRTAFSMEAESMNGEVHCMNTVMSKSSSRVDSVWMSADSLVAVSPAMAAGRRATSAPARWASAAMPSWSVETTTRSMLGLAWAAWTARASSETPATFCRFFSGMPFDPPRAGMIATVRCSVWCAVLCSVCCGSVAGAVVAVVVLSAAVSAAVVVPATGVGSVAFGSGVVERSFTMIRR